ncbi:uncharacterized protein METZ01_LOCUS461456, partial [marine metagenome]
VKKTYTGRKTTLQQQQQLLFIILSVYVLFTFISLNNI